MKVNNKQKYKVSNNNSPHKKNKHKMPNRKKPNFISDMDAVTSDPRFSHVGHDPKFRYMPKEKKKVKIDDRFSSLMTVSLFD